MSLSLAAYQRALLCELEHGYDADVLVTLDHIRDEYPDEFHKICHTILEGLPWAVAA